VELVRASRVTVAVDGHVIPDAGLAHGLVVTGTAAPRIVVQVAPDANPWQVLESCSAPLMELVQRQNLQLHLQLRLVELERRCGAAEPTLSDLAAVLRLGPEQIAALDEGVADVSDVLPVIACVDVALAEELRDVRQRLDGRDALAVWLAERLGDRPPTAEAVLRLADLNDVHAAVQELGVELRTANAAFRTLGLPLLQNPQGHRRQMAEYLQTHATSVRDALRDHFAAAAARGDDLGGYVRLRGVVQEVEPDERWLDAHWNVPDDLLEQRVNAWLRECAPGDAPVDGLPPVDELRQAGQRGMACPPPRGPGPAPWADGGGRRGDHPLRRARLRALHVCTSRRVARRPRAVAGGHAPHDVAPDPRHHGR
jgi:hypothetical protein